MREVYTNEELAERIKAGERDLLPLLWQMNKRSIYLLAVKYRGVISQHAFVDLEDFIQCGYFALLEAVEAYDAARGWKLSAYLPFKYKKQVYAMFGNVRDGDARIFPLAPSSLNVPIENKDGHETEVIDLLEDEKAGRLEEDCEKEELRQIVRAAVDKLPERERFTIREVYFAGKLKTQLVDGRHFKNQFEVTRAEDRAFRFLRRDQALQALRRIYFSAPPTQPNEIKATPEAQAMAAESWDEWIRNATKELGRYSGELRENEGNGS